MKRDSNTNETKHENAPADLFFALTEAFETGFEWLLARENGAQAALKRTEIDVVFEKGNVFLECPLADGIKSWQINSLENKGHHLIISAKDATTSENEKIELIRRISAADLMESIRHARLEIGARIAQVAAAKIERSKVASIRLSKGTRAGEYGNNAQVMLQSSPGRQIAVFAQVIAKGTNSEAFLVSALNWFINVSERAKKNHVEKLWLIADRKVLNKIKKILALLKPDWRAPVSLFLVDLENEDLREIRIPEFRNLWREKPRKLKIPGEPEPTGLACDIVKLAPEAIDITYSAHGENLLFRGLPFARVRSLLGTEKAWFGIDKKRRVLHENDDDGLQLLVEELKEKRSHAPATNKDHYYYRSSPEHWLESILQRDITRLDANLILSPIYRQFRASSEQIDLLALRRDGRLVVIELKVSPSRESVFQAANYWRLIELHRRSGNLREARAFGDLEILDEPALVYLVAPALSFHHDLEFWAQMLSPKIEIYRYSLHENWRENIKVIERRKF